MIFCEPMPIFLCAMIWMMEHCSHVALSSLTDGPILYKEADLPVKELPL